MPIFCPAIADSSIGMGLSQARHRDQTAGHVDVIGDIIESANIVIRQPSTATIVLGGGTPKNFINQASVQAEFYDDRVGGHKFAIQIVTDVPHFGGAQRLEPRGSAELGQAVDRIREGHRARRRHAGAAAARHRARNDGREAAGKRKRPEFDPSGRLLVMNGQPLADNRYQET